MTISTSSEKMGLVDTNVLVYRADHDSAFHIPSVTLIQRGIAGKIPLCLAPQNLTEFFAVITSPKRVTNPITPAEAREEIEQILPI
jgi:predicted nucleic acid-binding protein